MPLRFATFVLLMGLAAWGFGCQPAGSGAKEAGKAAGPEHWFSLSMDGRQIEAQVVVRPLELQRGLMGREQLAADAGMLFVFERPQPLSFWMRNTPLPLDIGYFTPDGILREVYALHPFDETSVPSVRQDLQLALEMNRGWFRANGIRPGASLDMSQVRAALRERGIDPERLLPERR
jgi:uncharacterized protein